MFAIDGPGDGPSAYCSLAPPFLVGDHQDAYAPRLVIDGRFHFELAHDSPDGLQSSDHFGISARSQLLAPSISPHRVLGLHEERGAFKIHSPKNALR